MPHNLNIVLVEPEIPMNTGTIGRLCLATGATLHLIEPLGFEINDSQLKRAGLDYWKFVTVKIYPDLERFFSPPKGNVNFSNTLSKKTPICFLEAKREDCPRLLLNRMMKRPTEYHNTMTGFALSILPTPQALLFTKPFVSWVISRSSVK